MTIEANIVIHVHLASMDEVKSIKHALTHLTTLTDEIMRATITDPEQLNRITERIKTATETLKVAVQASGISTPTQPLT